MSQAAILNSNINSVPIIDFRVKDPMSALTHFIGCMLAIIFTPVLLIHASSSGADTSALISLSIFMLSMFLLYGASSSYHCFMLSGERGMKLKRMDHMMIFVLIAGTYTPVCTIILKNMIIGKIMLFAVWGIAFAGMLFKLLWVTCPKWISSVIYIAMGWVVIFAMPVLVPMLSPTCFGLLLGGGIIYTIGGVIYALKLIKFNSRQSLWGSHEIFHLFVLAGSLCHFLCIYNFY